MFDAAPPPKLWTPPKPAIIRARGAALYRLAPEGKRAVFPIPFFCPSSGKPLAIAAYNTSTSGSGTSHSVSLPAGIAANDILLLFFSKDGTNNNVTTPSGWSLLFTDSQSGGSGRRSYGFWKVATGSEGSTVSVTSSGNIIAAHSTMRIEGADTSSAPEASTFSSASSAITNPDPPSLTPSWGALKSVWIAFVGVAGGSTSQSGQPSGYGNPQTSDAGNPVLFTADKVATVASDDPGTFTITPGRSYVSATVAVKGA